MYTKKLKIIFQKIAFIEIVLWSNCHLFFHILIKSIFSITSSRRTIIHYPPPYEYLSVSTPSNLIHTQLFHHSPITDSPSPTSKNNNHTSTTPPPENNNTPPRIDARFPATPSQSNHAFILGPTYCTPPAIILDGDINHVTRAPLPRFIYLDFVSVFRRRASVWQQFITRR